MRVLQWYVPLDDEWHEIGAGQVALVGAQADRDHHGICVWTVESDPVPLARPVRVFGTGHDVPDDLYLIGSCQDGPFVWHVFGRHIVTEVWLA